MRSQSKINDVKEITVFGDDRDFMFIIFQNSDMEAVGTLRRFSQSRSIWLNKEEEEGEKDERRFGY